MSLLPIWTDPLPRGYWFYNLSLTFFWAYVTAMLLLRAQRLGPRVMAGAGAVYGVGLALVVARFVIEIPLSGHAVWMYSLVVLAVRLELGPWAVAAALALIVEVIAFKTAWHKLPSVAWGSLVGAPFATFLALLPGEETRSA